MSGRSTARGFTLAELLIAVGLLVVLVVILLPVCNCGSRPAARRAACMSNLKQLASAVATYTGDFDGEYPPAGLQCSEPSHPDGSPGCPSGALMQGSNRFGYTETWQGGGLRVLLPYTKTPQVVWCPHSSEVEVTPTPTDPKSYYAAFEWLERPARVRYPEAKVLLLEAYAYHEQRDYRHEVAHPKRHDESGNPERKVNVAFVDGHVKWIDLRQGCSGSSSQQCAGWESCMGPGGNGNYLCSGRGRGAEVPDFPVRPLVE